MNKSYKKKLALNCYFVLFCSSLLKKNLIFNIYDLILPGKNYSLKKTKGKQIFLNYLQLKNIRNTFRFDYTVLFRRQISNYSMQIFLFFFFYVIIYSFSCLLFC